MKTFILGITGGVGAGKSTVLDFLEKNYGALLIKCDELDNELKEPGQPCYEPVIRLLGERCLDEDKRLDRKCIANIVFKDKSLLKQLNAIIHPAVKNRVREIIRENRDRNMIVIEAALLLEDNYREICDEIWYVYASEDVRRKRLKESRGYTDERINNVFRSQASEESFREQTDLTIDNSSEMIQNTWEQIENALSRRGVCKMM